jgi:hypothetical protein
MPNDNPLMMGGPRPMPSTPPEPQSNAPSMDEMVKVLDQSAYLQSALGGLLRKKDAVTRNDIFDVVSDLVDEGVLTPQRAAAELATMPPNEQMLKPWLFMHWKTAQNNIQQVSDMIDQMRNPQTVEAPMMNNRLLGNGG